MVKGRMTPGRLGNVTSIAVPNVTDPFNNTQVLNIQNTIVNTALRP
ncbi:hypothetical protein SPHINGO8AM_30139 [Sphingomonas sp. 8AM]|nr:hypothetical protein SPHINGO8AM_30139 [Sphingomonas sp. 8AM]